MGSESNEDTLAKMFQPAVTPFLQRHGPMDVTAAIIGGLDSLSYELTVGDNNRDWTKAIKTVLCERGRKLGCQVGAGGVNFGYGEWLYDVTWLEYSQGYEPGLQNQLMAVHLVAECEWGGLAAIKHDFEKLLLAPQGANCLMVYNGNQDPGSEAIANRLDEYIRNFNGFSSDWEKWVLAAWERNPGKDCYSDDYAWSFEYFSIGRPDESAHRINRGFYLALADE